MTSLSLDWKGDAVLAKARAAALSGVDRTMGQCVEHAKRNHPWKNRSGVLEGGVRVVNFADAVDGGVQGRWGVLDVKYALAQELGAVIKPVKGTFLRIPQPDGTFVFVEQVTLPAQPYLLPAADAKYPNLPKNIRIAFNRAGRGATQNG